jgi:hypothetical protein
MLRAAYGITIHGESRDWCRISLSRRDAHENMQQYQQTALSPSAMPGVCPWPVAQRGMHVGSTSGRSWRSIITGSRGCCIAPSRAILMKPLLLRGHCGGPQGASGSLMPRRAPIRAGQLVWRPLASRKVRPLWQRYNAARIRMCIPWPSWRRASIPISRLCCDSAAQRGQAEVCAPAASTRPPACASSRRSVCPVGLLCSI